MAGRVDHLFRSAVRIRHSGEDLAFDGYAGIVRRYGPDHAEAALFRGRYIAAAGIAATIGLEASTEAPANSSAHGAAVGEAPATEQSADRVAAGVEAAFAFATVGGLLGGQAASAAPLAVRLELPSSRATARHKLYVDGKVYESKTMAGGERGRTVLTFALPAGRSDWQWTDGDAVPGNPGPLHVSLASPQAADIEWGAAAGADGYELAVSKDGCRSWQLAEGPILGPRYRLEALVAGTKLHVKVRACRGQAAGAWAEPYPIYPSERPPAAPQGLRLSRKNGAVEASWGDGAGRAAVPALSAEAGRERQPTALRGAGAPFSGRRLFAGWDGGRLRVQRGGGERHRGRPSLAGAGYGRGRADRLGSEAGRDVPALYPQPRIRPQRLSFLGQRAEGQLAALPAVLIQRGEGDTDVKND
ncbi:fibronectin type III domain-containing protein [Cohnella rhizosphaerae]|uniref:Fibronectin type III domain-containing protein n=1 Tax=Cohnella rhizosphaerae TaxID=1457232 RepID=A0A9X4L0F8_9BACL|nr:fibronectin type III domain-containing protein [Cohnella rhizosphaerae]MDG0813871.1 fibronectin type III domain-containing protein [Cohnella rhizosphaerae]